MKKLIEGLVDHAKEELTRAGLIDKDRPYDGMIGDAVLELMKVFASQGHSGFSATVTSELFDLLSRYKTLTPITNDPAEWMNVREHYGKEAAGKGMEGVWQNKRDGTLFSNDGGKTHYSIDDKDRKIQVTKDKAAWEAEEKAAEEKAKKEEEELKAKREADEVEARKDPAFAAALEACRI